MFTKKRILAWLLCLAMVLTIVGPASVRAQQPEQPAQTLPNDLGEYVIYGEAGETTYVPAGYTYVYTGEDGQTYTRETTQDTYVSTRVLTSEEAEALAKLDYGEGYMVNADGQNLLCREFNAQEATAYSEAVHAILDGVELKETDNVSVLCEAYTAQTPVRALITFADAPVIRMESMSVSLGKPLGKAELQAARAIEHRQTSIMAQAEQHLGYDIEISNQFSLLTNAVAATVNYGDLAKISQMDGIKSAVLMPSFSVPELETQVVDADFVLTPNMQYAAPGMGAENAWDLGYKGEGMSVAILDTGLSFANVSFSIEPSDPNRVAYTKDEIAEILATADLNAETLSADTAIDTVYYSSKVPFGFDYGDGVANFGEDTAWQGHGSHVAGIVAGNLPDAAKVQFQMEHMGIAPEAQLIIMKVFDMMGQGYLDYMIAAMEDAITLGVDCANLSLGVPSGPYYFEGVTEIFDAAYEAGINVVVSAGNEAHSGLNSFWGDNMVKSDSVSTGTVGMPGTFDSVLTVASAENAQMMNTSGKSISWYSHEKDIRMYFNYRELKDVPEGKGFTEQLKGQSFDIADSLDLAAGKLLFLTTDGSNADDLIAQAAEAGAAGLILTVPMPGQATGWRPVEVSATRFDIPTCVTECTYATVLANGYAGVLQVDDTWIPMWKAGEMSSFSSWGPTESLTLKPEITGIGGNVFSAHMGNQFAVMSGTSMASPTVAASAALLRQYLQENELVAEEDLPYVVNCLLMSTATPVYDEEHGTYYFVRRQGAGLANIGAAMASGAYITVEGTNKAKLELGDDPEKVGIYEMTFNVVNFDHVDKSYTLDVTALGQKAEGGQIKDGKVTYLTYDYAQLLDAVVSSNLEDNTITIPAGTTAEIKVTLELTQKQRDYYNERFPAGAYVEGFIRLLSDETPSLVVPFLGFYGNFDDAPVLDTGSYVTTLGGEYAYNTADQVTNGLWSYAPFIDGTESIATYRIGLGATRAPGVYMIPAERYDQATMWRTHAPFYPEQAGISPNGDSSMDILDLAFGLRRNVENIHFTISNYETGEIIAEQDSGFMQKSYSPATYAGVSRGLTMEWLYPATETPYGLTYDFTKCLLDNNTWVQITADVTPEGASEATESLSFIFYIDLDAPADWEDLTIHTMRIPSGPNGATRPSYTFNVQGNEHWFLTHTETIVISYNEETGRYFGNIAAAFYISTGIHTSTGTDFQQMNGLDDFGANSVYISMCYDYAGNVKPLVVHGGESLLDHVDLTSEKTELAIGDTLTIRDVGDAPYHSILDWSVSDPSIAQIVETTDHSVTIQGLSRGTVTVYGGLGEYVEGVEITVTDPAFDALQDKFVDVPGHWAEEDILEAVYRGLFTGTGENTFSPNTNLTRAQLVTVLYRMAGSPEVAVGSHFADVPADTWYTDAVAWGKEAGIVKGLTEDTFAPNSPVSRQQLATFLYRYAETTGQDVTARADLSVYTDAGEIQGYAIDAVSWAVAIGLIQGTDVATLSPSTAATRAQTATMLVRYLKS